MSDSTVFKAAAVQAAPVLLDLEATVAKGIDLIEEAAGKGARLIVFPEAWIPGYPMWPWLGPPIWSLPFIARYHEASMTVESESVRRLAKAAGDNDIVVVMGFSERDHGTLYISQLVIDDDGTVLSARRKLKPTHVERSVFGEGDGSHLQVHPTAVGRLGALSCWEHLQPLVKFALYSMHEQIHAASWPSLSLYLSEPGAYSFGPELTIAANRMYAAEGQCFVVASTAVMTSELIDILCDTSERRGWLGLGGGYARIFGPDGRELAEPLPPDHEGLLVADIDLSLITYAKAAADPVGHYARADALRLMLNAEPRVPVVPFEPERAAANGEAPSGSSPLPGLESAPDASALTDA